MINGGTTPTRTDIPQRRVYVVDIHSDPTMPMASIVDEYGGTFWIRTDVRSYVGVGPKAGEHWLLDTDINGDWLFKAKLYCSDDDADTHQFQGRPIVPDQPQPGQFYSYDPEFGWILSPVSFHVNEATNKLAIQVRYSDGTTKTAMLDLAGGIARVLHDQVGTTDVVHREVS